MTAPATFTCDKCKYSQKTPASAAGQRFSCPKCGNVAVVVAGSPVQGPLPSVNAPISNPGRSTDIPAKNAWADASQTHAAPQQPQQNDTEQLRAAMFRVNQQSKSVALALVLTFFLGGFGTLYASIGWGIVFSILEIVLFVVVTMTFGLAYFLLVLFHLICLIYAAVSVNNHNKRLWNEHMLK